MPGKFVMQASAHEILTTCSTVQSSRVVLKQEQSRGRFLFEYELAAFTSMQSNVLHRITVNCI